MSAGRVVWIALIVFLLLSMIVWLASQTLIPKGHPTKIGAPAVQPRLA
jgi:lipopolysaccharide export LptBFGC system permease protein LptF